MLSRNFGLFKIMYLGYGLWLFSPLAIIYFKDVSGSYTMGMLAFSLISLAQCLLEIPCGIFSDRISRKANLVAGNILLVVNMVLWALAGYYKSTILLLAGSIFRGWGFAFRSGTITAIIYETSQDIKKSKSFSQILADIYSYYYLGNIFSAFIAAFVVYSFSIQFLVNIAIIPFVVSLIASFYIINPKNRGDKKLSLKKHIKKGMLIFLHNKKLSLYALLQIFRSSLLTTVFRFEAGYFETLVPLSLMTLFKGIQSFFAWISYFLVRCFKKVNLINMIYYSLMGNSLMRIISLALNNSFTPFVSSLQNLFYGTMSVSSTSLLQREYNPKIRATLDSMVEFGNGIVLAIVGYVFGILSDLFSVRLVILGATLAQVVIAIIYKNIKGAK